MNGVVMPSDCALPSWDNVAIEDNGWSFEQKEIVVNNVKVNLGKKEINFDMMKHTHYICNQMINAENGSSNEKRRKKKTWQTILDIQSTRDIIINEF